MNPNIIARTLCAGLFLLVGLGTTRAEPDRFPIPLLWGSHRGKLYVTTTTGNGLFAGKYDSSAFGCPGLFPVAGRIAYDRIVFSVNFDKCGTFVSWDGTVQRSNLVMNYRLVYTDPVSGRRVVSRGRDILKRLW